MTDTPATVPPPEEPSMEIHKPKPVHSWRELLTEIGVVVIGVCIALAAEQTVEWLHWRAQVSEAKGVIATELVVNMRGADNRLAMHACTERRLDELALILDEAAKKGSLPPLGDIAMPPRNIWPTGAWESVVASQTATHFPRQLLTNIATAYKSIERIQVNSDHEIEAWTGLYSMVGPGRRLDAAAEADLRKAISQARTAGNLVDSVSLSLVANTVKVDLPFEQEDQTSFAAVQFATTKAGQTSICKPIGTAPASYGHGFGTASVNPTRIDAAMKSLRDVTKGAP